MRLTIAALGVAAVAGLRRPVATRLAMSASAGGKPFLILGSKSETRQAIVADMGFDFRVETADIDEKAIGDRAGDVRELVLEIGKAKAAALLPRLAEAGGEPAGTVLLTGDQVSRQPLPCRRSLILRPRRL